MIDININLSFLRIILQKHIKYGIEKQPFIYYDVTNHSDQNLNFTNEISTPENPHVNVFSDFLMAVFDILKRQWPPKVVGTVAWNCQEIDISRFIVVFHTNSPPSPPETMLRRRRNMSQDVWCTWST